MVGVKNFEQEMWSEDILVIGNHSAVLKKPNSKTCGNAVIV